MALEESTPPYVEESFGILTDDDVFLDSILIKPAELTDDELGMLRVWVPKFPLTKASLITCARQEVASYAPDARIAHLVFDLRGSGESEGVPGDVNFQMDLHGIRAWAEERFGAINFGFLGFPEGGGAVLLSPIRPGVVLENYYYRAAEGAEERPPVIYCATYGNFDRADDAHCLALAESGYDVYGLDPLRYLLLGSLRGRMTVSDLCQDMATFCRHLPGRPLIVGQPISAGLALLWASGVNQIGGVVAIGRAQAAFQPGHIFKNYNPHAYFLGRYVPSIAPRPVALVIHEGHPLGGNSDELEALLQTCGDPRRLERVPEVTATTLLDLLGWLERSEQN